jgi:hypothetical protein
MKTNGTPKIEADLLLEPRILAAEEAELEQAVRDRKGYQQARLSAVARLRQGFDLNWKAPRSRDELTSRKMTQTTG